MNSEKKHKIFERYSEIVDFFEGLLGDHYEIVLLDVNDLEHSIVDIRNPYISGREIGDPISDFGRKLLKNKIYKQKPHVLNHLTISKNGKNLKSSTLFIKDDEGELAALLCINIDMTEFIMARNIINRYYNTHTKINGLIDDAGEIREIREMQEENNKPKSNLLEDSLQVSVEGIVSSMLSKTTFGKERIPLERLTPEEKYALISELNEEGLFLIKGSVIELAKKLSISENTVYRYIKKNE